MAVHHTSCVGLLLLIAGLVNSAACRQHIWRRSSPARSIQLGENTTAALVKQCYGIYGCFAITKEWISLSRPISVLPQSPKQIAVRFCLYNLHTPDTCQTMYDNDHDSLTQSSFLTGRPTKILAHGYLDSGEKRWIKRMVAELVASGDVNVVVVNWVGGSGPPYTQAVANIRLVGAVVGHFIQQLQRFQGVDPRQVHVIGHSLGAHLAGYVGNYLKKHRLKLGRITGLDPAEPHFENTAPVVRLDPSDAMFVDVIHTDSGPIISGGLGLVQPIGHMDFFPNGGIKQPGCGASVFEAIRMEAGSLVYGIRRFIGCNHLRAFEYFTESINHKNRCHFTAVKCDSYERFKAGECDDCHPKHGNCHYMGYYADKNLTRFDLSPTAVGSSYFLITGKDTPFCRSHYRITVSLSDIAAAQKHGGDTGLVSVRYIGRNSSTDWIRINDQDVFFEPGQTYTYMIAVPMTEDPISIELRWSYASSPLNPLTWRFLSQPMLYINRVQAVRIDDRKEFVFCGEDRPLRSGRASSLAQNPSCRRQQPPDGPSLFQLLADAVSGVGDSVMELVESEANVIPTRRRRRRGWHPRRRGRTNQVAPPARRWGGTG